MAFRLGTETRFKMSGLNFDLRRGTRVDFFCEGEMWELRRNEIKLCKPFKPEGQICELLGIWLRPLPPRSPQVCLLSSQGVCSPPLLPAAESSREHPPPTPSAPRAFSLGFSYLLPCHLQSVTHTGAKVVFLFSILM